MKKVIERAQFLDSLGTHTHRETTTDEQSSPPRNTQNSDRNAKYAESITISLTKA